MWLLKEGFYLSSEDLMLILEVFKDMILKMFTDTRIDENIRQEWFEEMGRLYRDIIIRSGGLEQ